MIIFRKAILFIHGFAGGTWDYGELPNNLQMYLDFDVYSFTLPGHDKMIINNVKADDWINSAEVQIEKLINRGYKKIYVIGHSMGGVIACHLATKYKEVKKLVLVAPAFQYLTFKNDKFDFIDSIKNSPNLLKNYSADVVMSRVFKVPIQTALEFTKLVKKYHNTPKNINCPTLLIHGTNDTVVPIESANYVHENINASVNIFVKYDKVTHDAFLGERHIEVIEEITNFLRNNIGIPTSKIINK